MAVAEKMSCHITGRPPGMPVVKDGPDRLPCTVDTDVREFRCFIQECDTWRQSLILKRVTR